jgi:uncharacterized membrane protein (UPF0127 family)
MSNSKYLLLIVVLGLAWSPLGEFGLNWSVATAAEASPNLPRKRISIGGKIIMVEIADDEASRSHGLMFRQALPDNTGMLFIFEQEQQLAFWMKNTLIPLSIGYFDDKKTLIDIKEMIPAVAGELRPKTYVSAKPALYALEVPKGWFARNKVELGSKFFFLPSKP